MREVWRCEVIISNCPPFAFEWDGPPALTVRGQNTNLKIKKMKVTTFLEELRSYAEARGLNTVEETLQDAGQRLHTDGATAIKYLSLASAVVEDNTKKVLEEMSISDLVDIYYTAIDNWLNYGQSPDIAYVCLDELSGRGWPF